MICPLPGASGARLFPHDQSSIAGSLGFGDTPASNGSAQTADLIVALGPRLNGPTTLTLSIIPARPISTPVHIHPKAKALGRSDEARLPNLAEPDLAAAGLSEPPVERRRGTARALAVAGCIRDVAPGP